MMLARIAAEIWICLFMLLFLGIKKILLFIYKSVLKIKNKLEK